MASVPDSEITAVERAHREYLAWRAEAIGASLQRLPGGGAASVTRVHPDHWYANRVICASPQDCAPAVALAADPHVQALAMRLEIAQPWLDDRFRVGWTAAGVEPAWEARVLASPLPATSPDRTGDAIVERVLPDGAESFWAAYEACFEEPQPERARHVQALAGGSAGVFGYTARIGDEIVAVALMVIHDHVAVLADAATRPTFRSRGIHTQLVLARLADARAAGSNIVTSDVEPGGGSDRNLIRLGLDRAFVREIWRRS